MGRLRARRERPRRRRAANESLEIAPPLIEAHQRPKAQERLVEYRI
jgi:hypothetical protein